MLLSDLIKTLRDLERGCGDMPVLIELENSDNELYLNYTIGDIGPYLAITNQRDYKLEDFKEGLHSNLHSVYVTDT